MAQFFVLEAFLLGYGLNAGIMLAVDGSARHETLKTNLLFPNVFLLSPKSYVVIPGVVLRGLFPKHGCDGWVSIRSYIHHRLQSVDSRRRRVVSL